MSTKEKILESALTLFSEYGYQSTSMRQIAAKTDIKAASIYNHFDSKRDILSALVQNYGPGRMEMEIQRLGDATDFDTFIDTLVQRLFNLWQDRKDNRLMQIMIRESLVDTSIAELLHRVLFVHDREMMAAVFQRMIDNGHLKTLDPDSLAATLIDCAVTCRLQILLEGSEEVAVEKMMERLSRQIDMFRLLVKA